FPTFIYDSVIGKKLSVLGQRGETHERPDRPAADWCRLHPRGALRVAARRRRAGRLSRDGDADAHARVRAALVAHPRRAGRGSDRRDTCLVGGVRLRRRRPQATRHARHAVPYRQRLKAAHGRGRRPPVRAREARSRRADPAVCADLPRQGIPHLRPAARGASRRHQALQGPRVLLEPALRHGPRRARDFPGRLAPVPPRHALLLLAPGFLRRETLDLLFTSQRTSAGEETGYGIGWFVRTDSLGHHWAFHGGSAVGGTAVFGLDRDSHVVVALLTNLSAAPVEPAQEIEAAFEALRR